MEFRMGMWLLTTLGIGALLLLWNKRKLERPEQIDPSFSYTNSVMYFNPIHGEGHLFIGGMLVILSFSQFCYQFAKVIVSLAE